MHGEAVAPCNLGINLGIKLRKTQRYPPQRTPANMAQKHPTTPGPSRCGPGGRGFKSRRSPLVTSRLASLKVPARTRANAGGDDLPGVAQLVEHETDGRRADVWERAVDIAGAELGGCVAEDVLAHAVLL